MNVTDTTTTTSTRLDPKDPLPSARAFVEAKHTQKGVLTLGYYKGVFYEDIDNASGSQVRNIDTVRAWLYDFLEAAQTRDSKPFPTNRATVSNVLDALKAVCLLSKRPVARSNGRYVLAAHHRDSREW